MVDEGDTAPDFTAPIAADDVAEFTLSEHLGDGPVVLAFFPGAFTGVCTTEMCTLRDRMSAFDDVDTTVYGVSVDTPFSLAEWRDQEDLNFGLVSDHDKDIIDAYGVRTDFADLGYYGVAERAVFVLDDDGTVTYKWVGDNPGVEPDYDEVEDAAAAAT